METTLDRDELLKFKTASTFKEFLKEFHPDYELEGTFKGLSTPVKIKCKEGHITLYRPDRLKGRIREGASMSLCQQCDSSKLLLENIRVIEGTETVRYEVVGKFEARLPMILRHLDCGKEFKLARSALMNTRGKDISRCPFCK